MSTIRLTTLCRVAFYRVVFWSLGFAAMAAGITGCNSSFTVPPPVSLSSVPQKNASQKHIPQKGIPEYPQQESASWAVEVSPRAWEHIVVHHTAAFSGSVDSIHQAHLKRKDSQGNPWRGIGYHFVIGNGNGMADGQVEPTFRWKEQLSGAHAGQKKYNSQGIGICFVGNFEETSPSSAQIESAQKLISYLKTKYNISSNHVVGHGSLKATACPGRFLILDEVNKD